MRGLTWQLAAAYGAGLTTPILLMTVAIFSQPVLEWLDRVQDRVRAWLDEDDVDVEPATVEFEAVEDEPPTAPMSEAWDESLRELSARAGRHRA